MTFSKTTLFAATALSLGLGAGTAMAQSDEDHTMDEQRPKIDVEAGVLTCQGEGGWGAIIASQKTFDCVWENTEGTTAAYDATITKIGIDVGKTNDTVLKWGVFAPSETEVGDQTAAVLEGTYVGIGAEATVGSGIGANALIGGGDQSFALQPISGQTQSGLNVAAGVQSLQLTHRGG